MNLDVPLQSQLDQLAKGYGLGLLYVFGPYRDVGLALLRGEPSPVNQAVDLEVGVVFARHIPEPELRETYRRDLREKLRSLFAPHGVFLAFLDEWPDVEQANALGTCVYHAPGYPREQFEEQARNGAREHQEELARHFGPRESRRSTPKAEQQAYRLRVKETIAEVIACFSELDAPSADLPLWRRTLDLLEALFEMGYQVGDGEWSFSAEDVARTLVEEGAVRKDLGPPLARMAEFRDRLMEEEARVPEEQVAAFWATHRYDVRAIVTDVDDYLKAHGAR